MAKAVKMFGQRGIGKDSENKFQKFDYRSVDSTLAAASAIFSELGIFVLPQCGDIEWKREVVETQKGTTRVDYTLQCVYQFQFLAGDGSGVTVAVPCANTGQDDSKLLGQTLSYAFKESLFKIFVIPVVGTEDMAGADTNRNQGVKVAKAATNGHSAKVDPVLANW